MKHAYTRRELLKMGLTMLVALPAVSRRRNLPLFSFSTLGCPDWPLEQIADFASAHGYDGVEFRGLQRELDLTTISGFGTEVRRLLGGKGLKVVDLGSSADSDHADDAKRYIDLAGELGCPYVRVFPAALPKEGDRAAALSRMAAQLRELGGYAATKNVSVLLETHSDLVTAADVQTVMKAARHPNVGLVWDIVNMWSVTKEPPAKVYGMLKRYIRHVHVKDLKLVDGKEQYVLLGTGDAPVFEAVGALFAGGYTGYYSFEWEKLWHPEIGDPAVALADYIEKMKKYLDQYATG